MLNCNSSQHVRRLQIEAKMKRFIIHENLPLTMLTLLLQTPQ